ncbi:MAG: GNAT family N-acetyltransferase [Candidatus Dormibacteria bacterium]
MRDRVTVRQATAADVDPILDLLTHYELPREAFEPFYLGDPTYRPEHSWVAEEGARLLAHLRIYDRSIRLYDNIVPMGGVGNVVTARDARGRGVARALLERVCEHLDCCYAISLLWTHAPSLYEAHGWIEVPQDIVVIRYAGDTERDTRDGAIDVEHGTDDDIDDALELLHNADAHRSGTEPRDRAQWFAQRAWVHEDVAGFRIVRDDHGAVRAHVRVRLYGEGTDVLEVGAMPGDVQATRALLAASSSGATNLRVTLPPTLRSAIHADEIVERPASQLMLRICSPSLLTDSGDATMQARIDATDALDSQRRARLLLYGCGGLGPDLDDRDDADHLQSLFPAQDAVLWQTDRF